MTMQDRVVENRRRDQEEAWQAGADAMLDVIVKIAQRHIDKTKEGSLPAIPAALFHLANDQYKAGSKAMIENPFNIARHNNRLPPKYEPKLPLVPKGPDGQEMP